MTSVSANEFLITTVLVCAFVGLSFGLDCFYCDPEDKGCDDPIAEGRAVSHCDQITGDGPMSRILEEQRSRVDPKKIGYLCATLKVENKNNSALQGFYRTCIVNTTTSEYCSIFKDSFKDENIGTVLECKACNETMCNNLTTTTFKNSSPESFTAVLFYTFLSCFFVIFVI